MEREREREREREKREREERELGNNSQAGKLLPFTGSPNLKFSVDAMLAGKQLTVKWCRDQWD